MELLPSGNFKVVWRFNQQPSTGLVVVVPLFATERRRAQIKQLAWPMAGREIGNRKSSLVFFARFPVVKWRSPSVAKQTLPSPPPLPPNQGSFSNDNDASTRTAKKR